jgi:hypothetical protein
LANAGWREELLDIGGDDPLQNGTTENIGALCQARDILIDISSGPGETLYSYEPLVFKRGFIPVTPEACILTDVPEIVTDAGEDVGEAIGEAFNDALCRFSGYNFCR